MRLFDQEIAQQQFVLSDTYIANKDKIKELAKEFCLNKYKGIALVGRGSSKNACWYIHSFQVFIKHLLDGHETVPNARGASGLQSPTLTSMNL